MIRNTSGQSIGAQMVDATSGAAFVGTVTVYLTIDAGTQAIGSVSSGVCTAEGNGYYTYRPTATETDGDLIAFTFIGSGAIPATIQVATITAAQNSAISQSTATGAITVSKLLELAAKRVNILQAGESLTADDADDIFTYANIWLDSLAIDRLIIPYIARTTWTISATKGTLASPYTVGSGGDINVTRPSLPNDIRVRYQNIAVSPTLELPLTLLTDRAWQAIPQKDLTSPLPTSAYYSPTYANNLGSLYLWFVPTQTSLQGVLYAPAQLGQFGSLSDTIVLPPGYKLFMQENLAVMFAATFRDNLPVDPLLVRSARESKQMIQMANVRMTDLSLDTAILPNHGGYYSIYSDSLL